MLTVCFLHIVICLPIFLIHSVNSVLILINQLGFWGVLLGFFLGGVGVLFVVVFTFKMLRQIWLKRLIFSSTIFIPLSHPCKLKKKTGKPFITSHKISQIKNNLINNNSYYIYIAVFQANTKISLLHPIMLTHFDTSASNKRLLSSEQPEDNND